MGLRYRKSFKVAPGVRMTVSKSGIGYSVGGKGVRVTKRADGRIQQTVNLPGSGLSYSSVSSASRKARPAAKKVPVVPRTAQQEASRRARLIVPVPRHMKIERSLLLIGLVFTISGFVVLPLLLLALPCLLVALVMMLINLKKDKQWAREYKAACAQVLADLLR